MKLKVLALASSRFLAMLAVTAVHIAAHAAPNPNRMANREAFEAAREACLSETGDQDRAALRTCLEAKGFAKPNGSRPPHDHSRGRTHEPPPGPPPADDADDETQEAAVD